MIHKSSIARNGYIDLLRLYFTMAVVVAHMNSLFFMDSGMSLPFRNGHISVEFFFIVSGFLMASSCEKYQVRSETGRISFLFLRHKIQSLYPVWFLAQMMMLLLYFEKHAFSVAELWKTLPGFMMSTQLGFVESHVIPFSWYIPCMLLCMAILFPLCYRFNGFSYCVAPVIAVFCAVFLFQRYGNMAGKHQEWLMFVYPAFFRGMCGLSLGCISFQLSKSMKKLTGQLSRLGVSAISLLELMIWSIPIIILTGSIPSYLHLPFILCCTLGIAITFSNLTWSSKIIHGSFFSWIGRVSYALYLAQFLSKELTPRLIDSTNTGWFIAVYLLIDVAGGICLYYMAKLLSFIVKTIRIKSSHLFIKQA